VARERAGLPLNDDLIAAGRRLGPWHIHVQVTPTVSTADFAEPGKPVVGPADSDADDVIGFYDPTQGFGRLLEQLFPRGLEGRSVLDCACNCGAYLFLCKDRGAGECFGFDARPHWIRQADWLLDNRYGDRSGVRFEVRDLYELPRLGLERFDVVLMRGVLYHLPMPMDALRIAANHTTELMLLSTATLSGWDDGCLVAWDDPPDNPLSGIHGFQWFPTGPSVLARMLRHAGLPEVRCHMWWAPPESTATLDSVDLVAARLEPALAAYDEEELHSVASAIAVAAHMHVPPRSTVAVMASEVPQLISRTAIPFVPGANPIAELEQTGADFLLAAAESATGDQTRFLRSVEQRYLTMSDGPRVTVHDLRARKGRPIQ
jgi:tRNA (mo5U34)-methyltransferase